MGTTTFPTTLTSLRLSTGCSDPWNMSTPLPNLRVLEYTGGLEEKHAEAAAWLLSFAPQLDVFSIRDPDEIQAHEQSLELMKPRLKALKIWWKPDNVWKDRWIGFKSLRCLAVSIWENIDWSFLTCIPTLCALLVDGWDHVAANASMWEAISECRSLKFVSVSSVNFTDLPENIKSSMNAIRHVEKLVLQFRTRAEPLAAATSFLHNWKPVAWSALDYSALLPCEELQIPEECKRWYSCAHASVAFTPRLEHDISDDDNIGGLHFGVWYFLASSLSDRPLSEVAETVASPDLIHRYGTPGKLIVYKDGPSYVQLSLRLVGGLPADLCGIAFSVRNSSRSLLSHVAFGPEIGWVWSDEKDASVIGVGSTSYVLCWAQ
jgi:hypothetical protein